MSEETTEAAVADEEDLARYILFSKWVRADLTVRPDAFIPHPYPDLSVTRHAGFSDTQVWEAGQKVAQQRRLTLYGRADLRAGSVRGNQLEVVPDPTESNRNHACINRWPPTKPEQMSRAQKLAADSRYSSTPLA
jgi:hypothetical protein